jgi:gliding motility-associated-like protein
VKVLNNSFGFNCQQTLTTNVNVLPVPTASFSLQSTQCNNTVSTSNLSSGNLGASPYAWDFGDGSPLVAIPSPSHTYADGSYTIALTVTDVNGCKSQRTATVSILNFQPAITGSATICDGKTRSLLAYGGTSYSWSPAVSLNNNTISNPIATPHATTDYSVHIVNVSQGFVCESTLTTQVLVNPTPTTAFTFTMNGCGGGVNFFDGSENDIASWSWTLAPGVNSQTRDPYYFYAKGGNFPVTLLTTNIYGCSSQLTQNINVPPPPQVSISNPVSICKYDQTQLHAGGGVTYQWMPTVSLDYPNLEAPTASPTVSTEYSVKITTSYSVNGAPCEYVLTTSVTVDMLSYAPANAVANPVIVTSGEPTTLTYLGDPGATVTWLPANTTPSTGYTVTAYPTEPTTYTAQVSRGACGKQVEVHVDAYTKGCLDEDVFIPNTFTPNGDGKNDILYVRGLKVDEIYFAVYDRWGERVFETSDKTKGWDGVYKNKPSDVGVFGWYLKAKCFNGLETFKKGNVTLIR